MNTDLEEWTYDDMVKHVTTSIRVALDTRLMNDVGAVITGFARDWSRVYADTPFFIGTVHNILESFNGERHYRKIFMRQAINKGYCISTLRNTWDNNIHEDARTMLKHARNELKNQRMEFYESILNAEVDVQDDCAENIKEKRQTLDNASADVSHAQSVKVSLQAEIENLEAQLFEHPQLQDVLDLKRNEFSQANEKSMNADKHAVQCEADLRVAEKKVDSVLQKSILSKFYNVKHEEITRKFLRQCEPAAARDAYFRLCLTIPNCTELTEINSSTIQARITEVMHHEGANLTSNGIMYAIDHMQKFTNGIKLALCHQLLHDIGFQHIFDTTARPIRFDHARQRLHSNISSISHALELKSTTDITDAKGLLKFCNMILAKCYKARVSKCPKKLQTQEQVLYHIRMFAFPDLRYVPACSEFVSAEQLTRAKLRA